MSPTVRNILAVLAGLITGMLVISVIESLGHRLIPPPEGIEDMDLEKARELMKTLPAIHLVPVLIAHQIGALLGAFVCARFAVNHHKSFALGVAGTFLFFSVLLMFMLPHPVCFAVADLALYLPMGWLGWKLAGSKS